MGRHALIFEAQQVEFTTKYIPKGLSLKILEKDENPLAEEYKFG